jgi:GTP 3',8-cyclase
MAGMGLRRVRLTGGEPLVRRDLPRLVTLLRAVTASRTSRCPRTPCCCGRRPGRCGTPAWTASTSRSTRCGRIASMPSPAGPAPTPRSSTACRSGGSRLQPIKVNAVIMRGRNDDEIEDFARITLDRPWHVRFIEVMPVGENLGSARTSTCRPWRCWPAPGHRLAATRCRSCGQRAGHLLPVRRRGRHGGRHHAHEPQLLRALQPDAPHGERPAAALPVRPHRDGPAHPLRAGEPLEPLIRHTLSIKPERHHLVQGSAAGSGGLLALSQIGG